MLRARDFLAAFAAGLMAAGCATTGPGNQPIQTPTPGQTSGQTSGQIPSPGPVFEDIARSPDLPSTSPRQPSGPPITEEALPAVPLVKRLTAFQSLPYWGGADMSAGLKAFRQTCNLWSKRDGARWVDEARREYGQYRDWETACFSADYIADDAQASRQFFENFFEPVTQTVGVGDSDLGLLTGYYEPEISVRRRVDAVFFEPILALPQNTADQELPRSQISERIAPVLAYGRPIDVFFMQVQGSGRLRFDDGDVFRAAFAGHNSHTYSSIGKVLVDRGEMTLEQASKQSIEAWMAANSIGDVQALMNENQRYVFFKKEDIVAGEGPKGAMAVPLVAMGAIAVDPRYHPYGVPVWLQTTLPQNGGDYRGRETGLLVMTQDTGGAIKGPLRADLFFGSGERAGELAGVMKHDVSWTLLLPTSLAMKFEN